MSDTIERIKRRIEARKWKITDDAFVPELIGMQYANNMNDWCLKIIDEELAKEPHEFKMRDATAEEQKYTQAKIDKIKEPQKCEWNRQGAEDFIITGCGHRPYKVIIDNCGFKIDFCPYCGRKIKVIE
jgi:hypothetical protein